MTRRISKSIDDILFSTYTSDPDLFDISVSGWTDSEGATWLIEIELKKVSGKWIATRVLLSSTDSARGITTAVLGEVPIHSILQKVRKDIFEIDLNKKPLIKPGSRRGRVLAADDHAETARLFHEATNLGFPIHRYLADKLEITPSAAAQRIHLARVAGALEPSTRGRAGQEHASEPAK